MNRTLTGTAAFTALLMLCVLSVHAQYNFKKPDGGVLNIQDLVQQHENEPATNNTGEEHEGNSLNGIDLREPVDLQYQRTLWYWQQHTDPNGNLVSPVKIVHEWEVYKQRSGIKNARTVSTNTSNWISQGPDTPASDIVGLNLAGIPVKYFGIGIGRINAVAFHPTDTNTYWVASDGGGAWKTTNNGQNWTAMTDNLPSLIVSDIGINPKNPNTIYLCTGDRDGNAFTKVHYPMGVGVLKTYDGGATWSNTGMQWADSEVHSANSIIINAKDTNNITLATDMGIYRSMDGGATWAMTLAGNFKQILYAAADTNVIFASQYSSLTPSFAPAQIWRSANNGKTWAQVTNFTDSSRRIAIAVCPSDPATVKAIVAGHMPSGDYGLYYILNSSDTGKSFAPVFTAKNDCSKNLLSNSIGPSCDGGAQAYYDLAIAVDPANSNNMYIGGVNGWGSQDGGAHWLALNKWSFAAKNGTGILPIVHGDKHFAIFHPLVPGRLFECNDGGIFYSDGPNYSIWNDVSRGIIATEFYTLDVSSLTNAVMAGAQDNGTYSIRNHSIDLVGTGDGGTCQFDPYDSTILYFQAPGSFFRKNNYVFKGSTFNFTDLTSWIPSDTQNQNFNSNFIVEPGFRNCLIVGYQQLFRSLDAGNSWFPISPIFDPVKPIRRIRKSVTDPETIYVTIQESNDIYASFDLGLHWAKLTAPGNIAGNSFGGSISNIETDPKDKTHIWVSYWGYGGNKVAEYSAAKGWRTLNSNLPDVSMNALRLDTSTRVLYLATDVGVFYKHDQDTAFQLYDNGLPVVQVSALVINYTTQTLWASTFGRGIWSTPTAPYVPSKVIATEQATLAAIVPNPNNGSFSFLTSAYYSNKRVDMRLVDAMGRTVWTGVSRFDGSGKVLVNTNGLAKSNYFFEAAVENEVIGREQIVIGR